VSPADVGARVTVRHRLVNGMLGDVVGTLESWDAGVLAIRHRDGHLVRVAASDIVVSKVIGPSLRAAIELEGISARGWPAPDSEWLGRWWLRAADGFTARANSVRPLGNPGLDIDAALASASRWYAARGLPIQVQVVIGGSLDVELRRRGWTAHPEVAVHVGTVERALGRLDATSPGSDSGVALAGVASSAWLGLFRGGDAPPVAAEVLNGSPLSAFAAILGGDGAAIAIGRAVVEDLWVGLTAIEVAATARRRGHAKSVMAALLQWARDQGAMRAYLEVLATNIPALTLYGSLGFTEHHRYACLEPPAAAGS